MNRRDFLKITGADRQSVQYLPIAFLLRAGYGCAGYYNTDLNQGIEEMCVLLNARIIALNHRSANADQPAIGDFNDFLEEVVTQLSKTGGEENARLLNNFGKSIPLTAVPFQEISVLYPVAQIGRMMQLLRKPKAAPATPPPLEEPDIPTLSDADLKIEIAPNITPPRPAAARPPAAKPAGVKPAAAPAKPVTAAQTKTPAPTPQTKTPLPMPAAKTKPAPQAEHDVPTFFDFDNKSVVLQALRTKLW